MWRFASLPDPLRILRAVVTGSAAMLAITIVLAVQPAVPRTVLFLMPLFLLCIMGGARATYRSINEFHQFRGLIAMGKPVLVVGAGQTAASLIRELARSPEWMLVGLL